MLQRTSPIQRLFMGAIYRKPPPRFERVELPDEFLLLPLGRVDGDEEFRGVEMEGSRDPPEFERLPRVGVSIPRFELETSTGRFRVF